MRKKAKPTDLESFLDERAEILPISKKALDDDLMRIVDEIQGFAGKSKRVNGALRYLMLQPLRSIAEDLEAIQRMDDREKGRRRVSIDRLGLMARWLVTPNARGTTKRPLPKRAQNWYPDLRRKDETLYRLPKNWHEDWRGIDFVIWSNAFADFHPFRAWPAKVFEPKGHEIQEATREILESLTKVTMPGRDHSTAVLRLSLAVGERRKQDRWIVIGGGDSFSWSSSGSRQKDAAEAKLPQRYAAAAIQHLGCKFGVSIEAANEKTLRRRRGKELVVVWNGAFRMRERIWSLDWLPRPRPPNR